VNVSPAQERRLLEERETRNREARKLVRLPFHVRHPYALVDRRTGKADRRFSNRACAETSLEMMLDQKHFKLIGPESEAILQ
jgi:hypothetical protein